MSGQVHSIPTASSNQAGVPLAGKNAYPYALCAIAALLTIIYYVPFKRMLWVWNAPDTYYSHGFLIVPISLFVVWVKRKELLAAPRKTSLLGYPIILFGAFTLILGDFLSFNVITQVSFLPIITGLLLLFIGAERTKIIWFALFFLLLMIPIPPSLTQSVALNLKLFAARIAVVLANASTLTMVNEGSFIYFKEDQLLVGEVCGGLRSLIALFSIGVLMAYFSKTTNWARLTVLALCGPIAIAANIFRIYILCVVAYFWGSPLASGKFHDISGVLIYAVAFMLFFMLEALLRRIASVPPEKEAAQ